MIDTLARDLPVPATPKQREAERDALSTLMRRDPATVSGWISKARQELQERASRYGQIHAEAVEAALKAGENEVAAKEPRAMLQALADDKGNWVIDAEEGAQAGSGITVQVGLQLGGMRSSEAKPRALPLQAELPEVIDAAVASEATLPDGADSE